MGPGRSRRKVTPVATGTAVSPLDVPPRKCECFLIVRRLMFRRWPEPAG